MTPRGPLTLALASMFALPLLSLGSGCGDEAKPKTGQLKSRETLNKKTQNVLDLKPELKKGGVVTDGKIKESDYLTVQADAYRTSVGNNAKMAVKHTIDLYEAADGPKPLPYEAFMKEIIKKGEPDGLMLPMLPYYQEYGYDSDNKQLVVIEYPEKKREFEEQEGIISKSPKKKK